MSARSSRIATASLAVVGIGIAAYLLYERYTGGTIVCSTGGCETVQESRYAKVAGVPVALIGLLGYVGLLGTTFCRGETARAAALGMALLGLVFSAYLLLAQLTLIHAVCIWCVGNDVVMLAIAVTAGFGARGAGRAVQPASA